MAMRRTPPRHCPRQTSNRDDLKSAGTVHPRTAAHRSARADETSRRIIDVAIGILIGLRGYSEREAFDEIVAAVFETGIGIGSISRALVGLANGSTESSADRAVAFEVWGEALAGRSAVSDSISLVPARHA
jgi:hypothetical protein